MQVCMICGTEAGQQRQRHRQQSNRGQEPFEIKKARWNRFEQGARRKREAARGARGSVEQMLSAIAAGEAEELPVVIKTDVHGSLEAIRVASCRVKRTRFRPRRVPPKLMPTVLEERLPLDKTTSVGIKERSRRTDLA